MVKTATNPQLTYRFTTILIRILAGIFFFSQKLTTSKFSWKYMRPRIAKTSLKKKNKVSGCIFLIL